MIKELEFTKKTAFIDTTVSDLNDRLAEVEKSVLHKMCLVNDEVFADPDKTFLRINLQIMLADTLFVVNTTQREVSVGEPSTDLINFLVEEVQDRVFEINDYLETHGLSDIPNPENIANIQPIYTGFEPEDFINGQGIEKLSKELKEVRALAYKLHGQIMRNIDDADDNERQICNKMVVCEKLDELDSAIIDLQKIVNTKGLIIETKNMATNANRIIDDLNTIFLSVGLRVDKGDTEDKPAPQKVDEESLPPTTGSKEKIDTSWFKAVSPLVFNNDVWENSHAMGGLRMAAKKTLAVIEAALVEASAKSFEDEADTVKNKIYVMDLEVLSRCVDGIIVEIDSFNCNRLTLMAKTQYFNNNMVLLFGYIN